MSKTYMAGTYLGLAMISNMILLNYNIYEFTSWNKLLTSIFSVFFLSMFCIFHHREEENE